MKKLLLLIIIASLLMTSCHTQQFFVYGEPGTIITSLDGTTTLGVIDQSGMVKVELDRNDGYDAFLQAKAPGSEKFVPFALDYKDCNRTTLNYFLGLVTFPIMGFLIFWRNIGSCYDYNYLNYQHTNNDLIK